MTHTLQHDLFAMPHRHPRTRSDALQQRTVTKYVQCDSRTATPNVCHDSQVSTDQICSTAAYVLFYKLRGFDQSAWCPSADTDEWVMSHRWMSHGTHVNDPWHARECVAYPGTHCNTWQYTATHGNTLLHIVNAAYYVIYIDLFGDSSCVTRRASYDWVRDPYIHGVRDSFIILCAKQCNTHECVTCAQDRVVSNYNVECVKWNAICRIYKLVVSLTRRGGGQVNDWVCDM